MTIEVHIGHKVTGGYIESTLKGILAILAAPVDQKTMRKALAVYSKSVRLPEINDITFGDCVFNDAEDAGADKDAQDIQENDDDE